MTRINTNVQSLIAQRAFGNNNRSLNTALQRLSSGLRINSGRDDPAGLIASETLRSSMRAISTAIDNAVRTDTIVAVAEGGLQEISSLQVARENVTAAESAIRDADFALETSNLTRAQILVSSSTSVLQLANAQPQSAWALLG